MSAELSLKSLFDRSVREARAEIAARGFKLTRTGGIRLELIPAHVMLTRARVGQVGEIRDCTWNVLFAGPDSEEVRGHLTSIVYVFSQAEQRRPSIDYYSFNRPSDVEEFADDFRRFTLRAIDEVRSPTELVEALLGGSLAPLRGWGKGSRGNYSSLAMDVMRIAAAYDLADLYRDRVSSILNAELTQSPGRRQAAIEVAQSLHLRIGAMDQDS